MGLLFRLLRSQSLFWRLQATVTLELREVERECGRRELLFNMVEGDFDLFQVSFGPGPRHKSLPARNVAIAPIRISAGEHSNACMYVL